MAQLTCNVEAKSTIAFRTTMFVLGLLGRLRIIDLEAAAKIVRFVSRKGWAFKYRIGNKKWSKLDLDFDYEIEEGN